MAYRSMRRRRFTRRRPVRRSYMRRRTTRRYGRSSLITGTSAATSRPGATNYRRRRVPLRTIKRRRMIASDASFHHRSTLSIIAAFNTPIASTSSSITMVFFIGDGPNPGSIGAFWQGPGGLVPRHGDLTSTPDEFAGGDLFIRGGMSVLTVTNLSAQVGFTPGGPIRVRTWRARTKAFGAPPLLPGQGLAASNSTQPAGWDPSLPLQPIAAGSVNADPYRTYHFSDEKTIQLETGQSFERTAYIRAQKVNQRAYFEDLNFRDFWIIQVNTLTSGTFAPYQYTSSFNLSFTGDRVT